MPGRLCTGTGPTGSSHDRQQFATLDRMRIAIAGATGVVGRHTAEVAAAQCHEVVPLARSLGVDVLTGAGHAGAWVPVGDPDVSPVPR